MHVVAFLAPRRQEQKAYKYLLNETFNLSKQNLFPHKICVGLFVSKIHSRYALEKLASLLQTTVIHWGCDVIS